MLGRVGQILVTGAGGRGQTSFLKYFTGWWTESDYVSECFHYDLILVESPLEWRYHVPEIG
jgi:GTPase SAR1 family protein